MSIRLFVIFIVKFIIGLTILVFKIKTVSISFFQIAQQENKMDQSVQSLAILL